MSLPRAVLPGQFYMVNRRCTQRLFLLQPDDEVNNAFTYCLIVAALKTETEIISTVAMSNHHHTVIFDRHGRYPEFLEHFHKLLARCLNAYRGRFENFWSSVQVCVVRLVEVSDVIDKLVYVVTNPVKDHLVEQVHQWPGVNSFGALRADKPLEATRPNFFFREDGGMPEHVSLRLVVPKELGLSQPELVTVLEQRIADIEAATRAERRERGTKVVGRRAIRMQRWTSSPSTTAPRRKLRPRIAAKDKWARIEAIRRNHDFLDHYREARTKWLARADHEFPPGTYWLRRFATVQVSKPS